MVKASEVSTYANWDLVSQTPRTRRSDQAVAGGTGTPGKVRLRTKKWPRRLRTWTTSIAIASPSDVRRYTQIWVDTRHGILPVSFTPPSPEDAGGAIPVQIDADQFRAVLASARVGSFSVDVTEYF